MFHGEGATVIITWLPKQNFVDDF